MTSSAFRVNICTVSGDPFLFIQALEALVNYEQAMNAISNKFKASENGATIQSEPIAIIRIGRIFCTNYE